MECGRSQLADGGHLFVIGERNCEWRRTRERSFHQKEERGGRKIIILRDCDEGLLCRESRAEGQKRKVGGAESQ
jgi:hypothetical protein